MGFWVFDVWCLILIVIPSVRVMSSMATSKRYAIMACF